MNFDKRVYVQTPKGPGILAGKGGDESILIDFWKQHFTEADWEAEFAGRGLSATAWFGIDEVEIVPQEHPKLSNPVHQPIKFVKPTQTDIMKDDARRARNSTSGVTYDFSDMSEGSVWKTKRKGDLYLLKDIISDDELILSWLEGKYVRKVSKRALAKGYEFVPEEEIPSHINVE